MIRSTLFGVLVAFVLGAGAAHAQPPAPAPAQPPAEPAEVKPNDYSDPKNWLCRPGRTGDACDVDLTTTIVNADGSMTREAWAADPKAPIDCFYVYPTVSTDTTRNSDMNADPAELNVILQQFARFGSKCRTFAPMYRQITIRGLTQRLATGARRFPWRDGVQYTDVRDAWQSYLKNDNQGRGVVLIGHSQGAFILEDLIKEEVEGKPIQKQLVGAYILGAPFSVPKGKDTGGDFKTIPVCRKVGQIGCVVNYSAFRSTIPPPANTLFGWSEDPAMASGCANPATLGGGPAPLKAYLSATGRTITGNSQVKPWAADKTVDTPFVSVPGMLTAECKSNDNATYLEITVKGDPNDPRVDDITGDLGAVGKPSPMWGLHLIDVNLAMGNLLDLVDAQSKAYRARK